MLIKKSGIKKRKIRAGISIGLLCTACLCFFSYAEEGPSSNVWIDVIQTPTEARISVNVPLLYGFVVVGSVNSGDNEAVSVDNGNLLLPNVKVKVITPSDVLPNPAGESEYALEFTSETALPIENFSTDVRDEDMDQENPPREGLPVQLNPYLVKSTSSIMHYWQASATTPTTAEEDFKKYQMGLDGMLFSVPGQKMLDVNGNGTSVLTDVIWLDGSIDVEAPPDVRTNGYTVSGTANIPSRKYLNVAVNVGGRQNQYKQVEESALVGKILWEIIPGELPAVTP